MSVPVGAGHGCRVSALHWTWTHSLRSRFCHMVTRRHQQAPEARQEVRARLVRDLRGPQSRWRSRPSYLLLLGCWDQDTSRTTGHLRGRPGCSPAGTHVSCAGSHPRRSSGCGLDGMRTRTKPRLGFQGVLQQKGPGERPHPSGGRGSRVGSSLGVGNTPSPLQQEDAHGHRGPSCGAAGKSPGKAAGPAFVSRVDTARPGTPEPGCDPRNAKPCSTWKTNRTTCPRGRKSNNKTHDSEQEPRRNSRKLGFSPQQKRSRVRNHRCPSYSERAVLESKHLPCTCRLCS